VNVGSLFAGIGGFDLGFERAGMQISWQVERDPYCQAVLARHFPKAARFEDVRGVGGGCLGAVDLICGGFPCQDLSSAGRGAGLDGARSGLWSEFARIVCELRPGYVVVENVPALLTGKGKRWDRAPVGRVLGDLAEAGYDAEWAVLSAREFGAPHLRKRVWIVAYPARDAQAGSAPSSGSERQRARPGGASRRAGDAADADRDRRPQGVLLGAGSEERPGPADAFGRGSVAAVADAEGDSERSGLRSRRAARKRGRRPADRGGSCAEGAWAVEPDVGRVADGVPDRVDRLAALGNALLPQIAEWIGRRILAHEQEAEREALGPAWNRQGEEVSR
jgi:DNA (cytosine-5)-methyltransferase 1